MPVMTCATADHAIWMFLFVGATIAGMLGSHLSIAGGMVNALLQAGRLKMECVQVFTKNQRQWKAKPLDASDRNAWLEALNIMGWDSFTSDSPGRVVSHNSYLINMASPDRAWT